MGPRGRRGVSGAGVSPVQRPTVTPGARPSDEELLRRRDALMEQRRLLAKRDALMKERQARDAARAAEDARPEYHRTLQDTLLRRKRLMNKKR